MVKSMSQSLYPITNKADEIREQFQDEYLSTEVIVLALMELRIIQLRIFIE